MGLEHLRPFLVRIPVPHLARFLLRSNLLKNRLSLFSTHMPHTHRLYYNKGIHTRLVHRGPSSRERRDGRWIRNRSALQHHRCKRLPGPQQVYQPFRWGAQAYPPPSSDTQFCRWRFLVWCRDGCVCVFFPCFSALCFVVLYVVVIYSKGEMSICVLFVQISWVFLILSCCIFFFLLCTITNSADTSAMLIVPYHLLILFTNYKLWNKL